MELDFPLTRMAQTTSLFQSNLIFPSGVSMGGCTVNKIVEKESDTDKKTLLRQINKIYLSQAPPALDWM